MRFYQSIIVFLFGLSVFAQEKPVDFDSVDSLYREDQFYAGLNYNLLLEKPSGVSQEKISFGFSAGFLRDMPIEVMQLWLKEDSDPIITLSDVSVSKALNSPFVIVLLKTKE